MKICEFRHGGSPPALMFIAIMLLVHFDVRASANAAQIISVLVPAGTQIMPRTVFTQTWTFQNTGTNTWSPNEAGYTLNLVGADTLGAVPFTPNSSAVWYLPCAAVASGKSVAPGAEAAFSLSFVAPEAAGSHTDTFQLSSAAGVAFGPEVTVSIVVPQVGSTNQYDRARAVSYANTYAGYVNSDGYFWTNGSDYGDFGALAPVPTAELGDDCAHFISSCIGQSTVRGGGLHIPSRVPPTHGEPGVARLVNTCLIGPGYATEVFSLSQLEPGDLIAWNWEGDTNIADLDHATLYLGNGLLASHSQSCLDVSDTTWFQSGERNWKWHLIHILDAPTIAAHKVKNDLVLSWGTNWSGYALYSATSASAGATWTKVTKSPTMVGALNTLTNSVSTGAVFYRLMLP
jgi:hypothetical protein